MGRRREERAASGKAGKLKHELMGLLFESPTGFAIFRFSDFYLRQPNAKKKIWTEFAKAVPTTYAVIRKEFRTFEDKASAINATGVSEELASMIRKWLLPQMKLAVGKPEYKTIIESDLKITCVHNELVMELMWSIQHQIHRLLTGEKTEVAKEDRLPMSQGLKMLLKRYGFDVKPEMVNDQIVETAGDLFECDAAEKSSYLCNVSLCLKDTSGINCENWGNLKLATALIVIFGPEEGDTDFREVLSEDEVSKLMDDACKYNAVLSRYLSLATYKKIRSAYRVRNENKVLLDSLIKKAKDAFEAEQAQVCEKSKVHGESEQTPQEHVISASKPPYMYEHPLPKGLKRSWNSAFEPHVLNKSTFCESLSLGETGSRRIASISEAQPSTSKAILPSGKLKHELMGLMFESLTGFAIFRFSDFYLRQPNAKKKIWTEFAKPVPITCAVIRKEFRTFENKASAINATGVSEELASMIRRWLLPQMNLAVGKPEYKTIIESKLEITCVHNELVMELMWGIQHLMHWLVPGEKTEVAKEDRLPMSQGLKMLLRRYGFDVKPEMVNDQIVATAGDLFECDAVEKLFSSYLRDVRLCLKNTSGINCENWDNLKVATALIVISGPEDDDYFREVLSEDEVSKLIDDAPKYDGALSMSISLRTYKKIRSAYRARIEKKALLESLIKKAKEACEAEQAQACEEGKSQSKLLKSM